MSWRYYGRAKVSRRSPSAFGVCDRCGFWNNLDNLRWQFEWRGQRLLNTYLRVCPKCLDVPFLLNKAIILPPDPVPRTNPRLQNFEAANNGTNPLPPLPWPVQAIGPALEPIYLLDDQGNVLLDDAGYPLLADGSPMPAPPTPVYVTPPLPPLPSDIESEP
jgi:hypothetical protein